MNGVFDVSELSLGPVELLVCFLELVFFFFFFFDFFRDRFLFFVRCRRLLGHILYRLVYFFLWENKNTDRVKGIHFSTYVVLQCWAKLSDTIILYVSFGGNLYALLLSVSLAFFVLFGDICFQEGKRKMLSCKSVVSQSASRVQSWHRCEL